MDTLKKCLPDVLAVLLFAVIAFAYFFPADTEGRILYQHDTSAGRGAGQEATEYYQRHDGEPLQQAIDTLRSLHSKSGRHVGVISHVEELRERIPTQIQVTRPSHHSASTIQIVG